MNRTDWERRMAQLWDSLDQRGDDEFLAAVETLAAELPQDDPIALFERGSAFDSTGHSHLAVVPYREALQGGLSGERRRRAVIQLASSLRNLGEPDESVRLLTAELEEGSDDLDDAVRAFLALALTSVDRERDAVRVALTTLAPHLTRYNRSVAAYANEIRDQEPLK